ncbi:YgjV family protein [Vibrio hippocampi]|uniref:Inner membrane protein YgjV n=1 Tax=Vibrio hippocampi TaxID=654686 RepID=A0ABN8DJ16_9VIBR|nr:YgjV family protein [Vibrio hippocampi]CAH0528776.1 Inner membrane protein YgjV [Vibrio hippocampi]
MLLAQIIGGVAFVCGVIAFLQKQDLRFRIGMVIFCFIMATHFTMMGATVAAIGSLLNGTRALVSIKTQSKWVMTFFILMLLGCTLGRVQHPIELLTIIGSVAATWSMFNLQGIKMRGVIMLNSFCWLTHNLWLGSIGGSLVEATFVVANGITIYKMYKMSQSKESNSVEAN